MKSKSLSQSKHSKLFIESDDEYIEDQDNESDEEIISSEDLSSENEDKLHEKYDLKEMTSGQSFRNPADNLLSDPKYRGKKAEIENLDLPDINSDSAYSNSEDMLSADNSSEVSQDGSSIDEDEDEDTDVNYSGSVFKKFKTLQSNSSTFPVTKPDILLKRNDEYEKAVHLKSQLVRFILFIFSFS